MPCPATTTGETRDPNDFHLTVPNHSRTSRPSQPRRGGSDPSADRQSLLAREVGAITKPHGGRLRVALAFPNTYFVGMSNLGLQTVYRLLNEPGAPATIRSSSWAAR